MAVSAAPGVSHPNPRTGQPKRRARWAAAALSFVAVLSTLGVTEATGVTHLAGTVISIVTNKGTLIIEIDDPGVQVSLNGEKLTISGAGIDQFTLQPGQYEFMATRDGRPVKQELVTITRGGERVVTVSREAIAPTITMPGTVVEKGVFVLLGGAGVAERKFDTLAEAVSHSSDGDTIEIRGNGPFVTEPLTTKRVLTIRAAHGFRPLIKLDPERWQPRPRLLVAEAPLVLEGLELQFMLDAELEYGNVPIALMARNAPLSVANCRFRVETTGPGSGGACIGLENCARFAVRNSQFLSSTCSAVGAQNHIPDSTTWHIENCLHVGRNALVTGYVRNGQRGQEVKLIRNTFVGSRDSIAVTLWAMPSLTGPPDGRKPIQFDAATNVFDGAAVLRFQPIKVAIPEDVPLGPNETERLLERLVEWRGRGNAYSASRSLLELATTKSTTIPAPSVASSEDWQTFWNSSESGSVQGHVRFEGGDLLSRLAAPPDGLAPEDFRLRPDSAGYHAGPDGKDLGADVDLVGPGPAYERWKQMPEYQQWLEETGQADKPE